MGKSIGNMQPHYDRMQELTAAGDTEGRTNYAINIFGSVEKAAEYLKNFSSDQALLTGLLQGISFGTQDEIASFAESIFSDKKYRDGFDKRQSRMESLRESNPGSFMGGEITGALFSPAPFLKAFHAALGPAKGALGAIGKGAVVGATAGAGYGAAVASPESAGGELGSRLSGAGRGAITGGPAGGVLGGAAHVASRVAQKLPMFKQRQPEPAREAEELVAQTARSGSTVPEVRAQADQLVGRHPEAMLGDVTPNLQQLSGGVATQPRTGGEMQRTLQERAAGRTERVTKALNKVFGDRPRLANAADDLIKVRKAASRKPYEILHKIEQPITPRLAELLKRPIARSAWSIAKQRAHNRDGIVLDDVFKVDRAGNVSPPQAVTMQHWDYLKQALDEIAFSSKIGVPTAATTARSVDAKAVLKQLVGPDGMLDKLQPTYAGTREIFAGPSKLLEAMQLGNKLFGSKGDDVAIMGERLATAGEIEAFITGAKNQITHLLESGAPVSALNKITLPGFRRRLSTLFPGGAKNPQFNQMMDNLAGEIQMSKAENLGRVDVGSRTNVLAAAQEATGGRAAPSSGPIEALTEELVPLLKNFKANAARQGRKVSQQEEDAFIEQVSKLLRTRGREEVDALLERLGRIDFAPEPPRNTGSLLPGVGGLLGPTSSRPGGQ
jgi:hypothetical protein